MRFQSGKAIYLEIADRLCDDILKGRWQSGEKLPSVRELAIDITVNPNTVARSYLTLQERRVIILQRGIGYFVAADAVEAISAFKKQQFIHETLPSVFNTMALLNISFDELRRLYQESHDPSELLKEARD